MTTNLRAIAALAAALALLGTGRSAAGDDPRRAATDAFVKKADSLIQGNDYDIKTTPHYKVKTDDPRFDVAAAAGLLESFYAWFEAFWQGRLDLRPCDEPMRVYLFFSRAKLRQLGLYEERSDRLEMVGRYQDSHDLVALHTDTVKKEDFPDELIHEAAHQLVQRRIYGMDHPPSIWIAEGLAEYFGNTSRRGDGRFETGRIGGKSLSLYRKERAGGGEAAWPRVRPFRRALGLGQAVTPDELLRAADPGSFYDQRPVEHYVAAWLLVHYLLHADGGAHAAAFAEYLKHDIAGDGGPEVFYRDLGMTREQLAAGFARYLDDLRPR